MTATSQNSPWVLKKAVLVYTPDFDVSCFAHIRIAYDESANQGSVSLRITADLANLSSRSHVLTLNISPEIVEKCALAPTSNDDLCSPRLVSMLRAPVNNVSAVSTLSLRLGTTGIVLCPSEAESLSPATPGDLNFHAFAKICQSKFLRLHFAKRQFVNKELEQLKNFSCTLRERSLQTESFDHARHGVVQRDWRAFSLSLDPPPYCEEPVSEQVKQVDPPLYSEKSVSDQMVGKRRRDPWSPEDESRKRLLPSLVPIGSPTEVNTPSTRSPSPSSIRPTYFTHAPSLRRAERNKLARLVHELRGVSDDLICELLILSGRQHLLAVPEKADSGLPTVSEKAGLADVDIDRRLKRYVDEAIDRRLKSHIVDEIVDSAVKECRDQFFDECRTNEAEFREQVDDSNCEVRTTANECMDEIREQVQKYMHELEEQAQQCMNFIDDQGIEAGMSAKERVAKLKSWLNTSPQFLLDTKPSPSHELGTNARHSSV